MNDSEIDKRFKETVFVVECNSNEIQMLWEKFCKQSMHQTDLTIFDWEQINPGFLETVGHVNDDPVCVSVSWARINGFMICFYEATSNVVNYSMIDVWMKEKCYPTWDKGTRYAHCDGANFHHVLNYVRYPEQR